MKHIICSALILFLAAASFAEEIPAADKTLVWSDEFSYTGLPDPAKWNYEEGFVRNKEPQYYTVARGKNCWVEDGFLVIVAREEKFENSFYEPGSKNWRTRKKYAHYTSASLTTKDTFNFTYGRIEVRARLPEGVGMCPVIWTLGADKAGQGFPGAGEIDIMELNGKSARGKSSVHYALDGKHQYDTAQVPAGNPSSEFHVYAIEWTPERIDFSVDDEKYYTFPVDRADSEGYNPFKLAHYLLISFALGSRIDESILPQKLLVDYVRIYSR